MQLHRSRYNISVETPDGEHLLFNSANGAFAVLDDAASTCYERCGGENAHLAASLAAAGFLTERTPEQELAELAARFARQRRDHAELTLVLAPTYACNYRCPYCYELGHNSIAGKMDDEVMEAVYAFIEQRHAEHAFERLSVQWYGGDPSLALDVVDTMSQHMTAWCDERGISYGAMMLTNCNLIDEAAVEMLARARVSEAFVTIDGFEQTHNARRVAADGSNSFERTIAAARLFSAHGIHVHANMNVDRVNWPQYRTLRDQLASELGVELSCARLCDYGHFFGTRGFCKPAFDLLEHDEYSRLAYEAFSERHHGSAEMQAMLAPQPRFCNGQRDDYYVIDRRGDVYSCDGRIGEKPYIRFNILDGEDAARTHDITFDPTQDATCAACSILPLCWGNCIWERKLTGMHCHPFATTLPDYLRDWRSLFGPADAGFALLVPPRNQA